MKLGFLTNALVWEGLSNIQEMADWAVEQGFDALEVGPKLPLDEKVFSQVIDTGKIEISALTYCRNFLSRNEEEAAMHRRELLNRIEAAGRLGIPIVVTSTGYDNRPGEENHDSYESIRRRPMYILEPVLQWLEEVLEVAEKNQVKIALENCPLMGNIAISPEMWKQLFQRLSSPNLGVAYDPSHLMWQMMDPYEPILELKDKIIHVHAKDTEILQDRLKRTGILTDFSWWRNRLPGMGELDWTKFISHLREIEYEGAISIEHEDPIWSGTVDKTQQGILRSARFMRNIHGF